ncbi:MAG: hypothetical protein DWQ09_02570 [Proteobacteria bacterium]|nr:MAG: hypothetical protein DWQ09_02570 [Pseudomonadota bacterium]
MCANSHVIGFSHIVATESSADIDIGDLRLRFHGVSKMARSLLARLIHIDYDREMAFVAHQTGAAGRSDILGVIDISPARGTNEAEFGVIVRSDLTRAADWDDRFWNALCAIAVNAASTPCMAGCSRATNLCSNLPDVPYSAVRRSSTRA